LKYGDFLSIDTGYNQALALRYHVMNGISEGKNSKIIPSYDRLVEIVNAQKVLGKVIVFLSGTFDLFHIGHCRYFLSAIESVARKTSKDKDDIILIVAVDSDTEVRKRKGEHRPIVPQDERAEMLTYTTDVDYVIIKQEEEYSWRLGELIKPDFLILSESTDFLHEGGRDGMIGEIKNWAKDILILPPQAETSTTGKIHKLHTDTLAKVKEKINSALNELSGIS